MIFPVTDPEGTPMGVPEVEVPLREGILRIPTEVATTHIFFLSRRTSSSFFIAYTRSRKET